MRTQSTSCRNRLTARLADAQRKGEYFDCFRVKVSGNAYPINIGGTDSNKERDSHTPPSGVDGDDVEVVSPPVGPSPCSCVQCPSASK